MFIALGIYAVKVYKVIKFIRLPFGFAQGDECENKA